MIRSTIGICALVSLFGFSSATIAKADTLDNFSYTSSGNTFVWQLPSSPVPDSGDVYPGAGFTLNNVVVSENGGPWTLGYFDFYSTHCAGGFDFNVGSTVPLNTGDWQLYSGPESAPTFLLGTFQLADYPVYSEDSLPGALVITQVPEPSSLLLLGIGSLVLLIGFSAKRMTISAAQS